jgi:hypothetical protein
MDWRRGLLLAGINLAVAVPIILMMEASDQEDALTPEEIMSKAPMEAAPRPPDPPTSKPAEANAKQAEETVTLDPCMMWVHYSTPVVVVQAVGPPAVALAGWDDCPPHWSLAGRLRGTWAWPPTPLWMETQREIDAGLFLFIAIQWFLVGGFPLVRTQKWWADPGSFITACTALAGGIVLIPVIHEAARLLALIAILGWFWWFGLLVWKTLQFVWRRRTIVS